MNLEQKLLVCEAMLARLDAAMASAEAEVMHSSALEGHLRRLLDNLQAEQARLDQDIKAVAMTQESSSGPVHGTAGAQDRAFDLQDLQEQMERIRAVQSRLLLLLYSSDSSDQHP
jgi:hypothetical protein